MRIHRALVIFAVIGTILITWYFRTKDMNFLAAAGVDPTADAENSNIATGSAFLQPEIDDQPVITPDDLEKNPPPPEPEVIVVTDADLGDLETAPGLAEYRSFAKKNPGDRLFELSSTLRSRGHFQRALLAIERVIDTAEPDPKLLAEASQGITALTPTLPRWNVDPETEIPLTLHLALAPPAPPALQKALVEIALLIRQSSGDQLQITPEIDSGNKSEAPADSPIALWISSGGDTPVASSAITLRLSSDDDLLVPELSLALFKAVRSHLENLNFPEAIPLGQGGPDLLSNQITRLMWRDFAHSLGPPPTEDAEDAESSAPFDEN